MALSKDLSFILLGQDKSASKTMSATAESAEKMTGRVGGAMTKFGGFVGGEFGTILSEAGTGISEVGEHAGKLSGVLGVAGGVVATTGLALSAMGSSEAAAQAQLKNAIENTGHSFSDYSEDIETTVGKMENFGHTAADTKSALTLLTTSTGSPKKAIDDMGVTANLAAAKHITLAAAATQVSRILNGQGGRSLAQYGIQMETVTKTAVTLQKAQDQVTKSQTALASAQQHLTQLEAIDHGKKTLTIADQFALQNAQQKVKTAQDNVAASQAHLSNLQKDGVTKTKAGTDALDELSKKLNGQATASTQSFGAQVNIMKVKVQDWAGEMGRTAGPAITGVGAGLTGLSAALEVGKSVSGLFSKAQKDQAIATDAAALAEKAAAVSSGVKTAATEGETIATEGAEAAQTGFNIALLANPIGIVIIAIVALVAGLVWFFTQTKIGKEIWADFTKGMAVAFTWLWTAVLQPAFRGIGVIFGWLWNSIVRPYFSLISAEVRVAGAVFQWLWGSVISPVASWVGNAFRTMASIGSTAFSGIGAAVKGGFSGAVAVIRSEVNGIIDVLNGAIGIINTVITTANKLPGVNVGTVGKIPHFAMGGIVNSPTVGLIGESGPEAIVPLNNGGSYGFGGGGGGVVIAPHITVQGAVVGNQAQMAQQIATWIITALRSGQLNNELAAALKGAA